MTLAELLITFLRLKAFPVRFLPYSFKICIQDFKQFKFLPS